MDYRLQVQDTGFLEIFSAQLQVKDNLTESTGAVLYCKQFWKNCEGATIVEFTKTQWNFCVKLILN